MIREGDGSASGSLKAPSTEHTCVDQIRRWISRDFTGCRFAQSFANKNALLFAVFAGEASPADIDDTFDLAASKHLPAIVVFPRLRTEAGLVAQVLRLAQGDRWRAKAVRVKGLETADLLLNVRWRTGSGLWSTPMGFGPYSSMPVTRRAPYVCVGTWPGGHESPFTHRRPPNPSSVDFLDAQLPKRMSRSAFDRVWDGSVERTTSLLAETNDRSSYYRSVAFRLSPSAAASWPSTNPSAGEV